MSQAGKSSDFAKTSETLVIENRLSELFAVEQWLATLVERWSIPPDTAFGVDLVINEAVTNVISYAFPGGGNHPVTLSIADSPGEVVVEIVDAGIPFDPLTAPAMVISRDLDSAPIGGRGIHLIKSYTDRQDYTRVAGYNRLTLTLRKSR
jgi:anti-sigma regulatory factor (Ser/Thr protein kinase)